MNGWTDDFFFKFLSVHPFNVNGQDLHKQIHRSYLVQKARIESTCKIQRIICGLKKTDWQHLMPVGHTCSSCLLAKTGVYYIGRHDHVKFYFSKVQIRSWKIDEKQVIEHSRWSPNCPLLKHREASDVTLQYANWISGCLKLVSNDDKVLTQEQLPNKIPPSSLSHKPLNIPNIHKMVSPLSISKHWSGEEEKRIQIKPNHIYILAHNFIFVVVVVCVFFLLGLSICFSNNVSQWNV